MTTSPGAQRPIVVKLGGSTLGAHDTSLRDIAAACKAGGAIVIVHGGGAAVSEWLARLGVKATFVRGLRVTDAAALDVVVAVLGGLVNKTLVAELASLGAPATGLSGADGLMLQAKAYDAELGFVGRVERVDPYPLEELLRLGHLPVIAPIGVDATAGAPQLLNLNADTAAGAIAAALRAERLVFLTDVEGVLDEMKFLVPHLTAAEARAMIESGVAGGGMIPKLEAAIEAAAAGCATRIVDGTSAGALARVLAGQRAGTTVTA